MISTGKWLELCEADAKHRSAAAQDRRETFAARVSKGSLAAPEEITVCRLLDYWRTQDLVYGPNTDGTFVFQSTRER